jgi:hypothetical protein
MGRILSGSWKNIGQTLVEYWVEVRIIFGGSSKIIDMKLEEYWAEVGVILG